MQNYRALLVIVLLLSILCVQGCHEQPSPAATVSPLLGTSPLSSVLNAPSLAAPSPGTPPEQPTPVPGQAVVVGRIVDSRTGSAPLEGVVYLGSVLTMDNGKPVVRLDQREDVFAIPHPDGHFVFPEVTPGEYGLVLLMPEISFLVEDVLGGSNDLVTVKPDEVLDLGEIRVSMP